MGECAICNVLGPRRVCASPAGAAASPPRQPVPAELPLEKGTRARQRSGRTPPAAGERRCRLRGAAFSACPRRGAQPRALPRRSLPAVGRGTPSPTLAVRLSSKGRFRQKVPDELPQLSPPTLCNLLASLMREVKAAARTRGPAAIWESEGLCRSESVFLGS